MFLRASIRCRLPSCFILPKMSNCPWLWVKCVTKIQDASLQVTYNNLTSLSSISINIISSKNWLKITTVNHAWLVVDYMAMGLLDKPFQVFLKKHCRRGSFIKHLLSIFPAYPTQTCQHVQLLPKNLSFL